MRKGVLIIAAIVALVGAAIAAVSTSQHLRLRQRGFEEASFCAISERINCDIVNASSYSEAAGVPVAWWGLAFYVVAAGMALFAAFSRRDARATVMVAWALSAAGILSNLYLGYVAVAIIGAVCIECLAMYAATLALFILFWVALRVPIGGIPRLAVDYAKAACGRPSDLGFSPRLLKHAIVVVLCFALSFFAMKGIQAKGQGEEGKISTDEKMKAFSLQSLNAIEPDPAWAVWGNPKAKVAVVEFSDFQCPFCRLAGLNLKPYLHEFRRDIALYFVNYPLDSSCNEGMERPMHPYGCFAAKAAICAKKRGDFWSFHDDLFRQQRKLNEETILALAEKRGWDRDEFRACIESPEADAEVRREIAAGRKIYVTGTPTIFVGNRKLKYWRDPDFLQAVVKEEIRKAKRGM